MISLTYYNKTKQNSLLNQLHFNEILGKMKSKMKYLAGIVLSAFPFFTQLARFIEEQKSSITIFSHQCSYNNTPTEQRSHHFDLFVDILLLPNNLVHYSTSSSSCFSLYCFGTPCGLGVFTEQEVWLFTTQNDKYVAFSVAKCS